MATIVCYLSPSFSKAFCQWRGRCEAGAPETIAMSASRLYRKTTVQVDLDRGYQPDNLVLMKDRHAQIINLCRLLPGGINAATAEVRKAMEAGRIDWRLPLSVIDSPVLFRLKRSGHKFTDIVGALLAHSTAKSEIEETGRVVTNRPASRKDETTAPLAQALGMSDHQAHLQRAAALRAHVRRFGAREMLAELSTYDECGARGRRMADTLRSVRGSDIAGLREAVADVLAESDIIAGRVEA
jgi:hypothetical protein